MDTFKYLGGPRAFADGRLPAARLHRRGIAEPTRNANPDRVSIGLYHGRWSDPTSRFVCRDRQDARWIDSVVATSPRIETDSSGR